jgi:uncharacterized protein (TIGR02145 family)
MEILSIFGISYKNMAKSEILDITVNREDNAILLAISVILQGDRSVRDLTELLTDISTDIKEDGKYDNNLTIGELRNSALVFDLVKIRLNLEKRYQQLGIPATIPDFEKYVNAFLAFTGQAPQAETMVASNTTATTTTLNGKVKANDLNTTVAFEYGTTASYGITVQAIPATVTGHSYTSVATTLNDLDPATTYHFRIKAINSCDTVYSSDLTITMLGKTPDASTMPASYVSTVSAVLNGTVNPNYLGTTISFEYGTSESYGSEISARPDLVSGNSVTNVMAALSQLNPGTVFHYRIKAVNSLGTKYGSDQTFTTNGKIPTALTQEPTNLSIEGATLNGTVNANDLSTTVTFEYGITPSHGNSVAAIPGQVTGNTSTNVSCPITGLTVRTLYYFRVKTVNSLGTVYGNDISFWTTGNVPSVTTNAAKQIKGTSAILNGIVNANEFSTEVTFEFGQSTSYGTTFSAIEGPAVGNADTYVSFPVTGLIPETIYHFRIKGVNFLGYTYANDLAFKTPPLTINDIDGNTYTAVTIGNQVWMAENLKTTRFNDNTLIPLVPDIDQWLGLTSPGYCWYNNDETRYKPEYGAIYNWYTLDTLRNGRKNVCPVGWHPPSLTEWREMIEYIGGSGNGEKLMETGTSHWPDPNDNATNETGFTGIPGGARFATGYFMGTQNYARFLTSSLNNYSSAWSIQLDYSLTQVLPLPITKADGASVRCVKNK